jgi:hypothetical protein
MSIKVSPATAPLTPSPTPPWGTVAPDDKTSKVVRFTLADRSVSFPVSEIERWELIAGSPEQLVVHAGESVVKVEGTGLAEIRDLLDKQRVCEIRITVKRAPEATGAAVRSIAIESA